MFSGRGLSGPPAGRPLTSIPRDAKSLYLVEGYKRDLAQILIMSLGSGTGTTEKVFKGQRSTSNCVTVQ